MSKNSDVKRKMILESAKKRFAHFGMSKTTMAEIAKDLSFSKALLYYYYPDKNSLYSAVIEYVIEEMLEEVREDIKLVNNVEDAIMITLEKRMKLINEYYNLFEFTYNLRRDIPVDLQKILKNSFEKELNQVVEILESGVSNNEFKVEDTEEVGRMLLFSLIGMRLGILKDLNNPIFPKKTEFEKVLNLQKKMAKIFLNGLKN